MDAKGLACPDCGAPVASDSTSCPYCKARLQTISCPSCFGMMFLGAKFCSHCGAKTQAAQSTHTGEPCPRCAKPMDAHEIGGCSLEQCAACGGTWLDSETFHEICEDRDKQAAFAAPGVPEDAAPTKDPTKYQVAYLPCPRCGDLMNRVNFAGSSGIVIDVCKNHGTWLDKDDLRAVVEFIRAGGLAQARADQAADLAEKRRALDRDLETARADALMARYESQAPELTIAGRLLRSLLG